MPCCWSRAMACSIALSLMTYLVGESCQPRNPSIINALYVPMSQIFRKDSGAWFIILSNLMVSRCVFALLGCDLGERLSSGNVDLSGAKLSAVKEQGRLRGTLLFEAYCRFLGSRSIIRCRCQRQVADLSAEGEEIAHVLLAGLGGDPLDMDCVRHGGMCVGWNCLCVFACKRAGLFNFRGRMS
jgi:hypothetical protein